MPVCRFVDDFFAAEDAAVAEHSMKVFAECVLQCHANKCWQTNFLARRLVDLLLGHGAAAPRKLECANPLAVLGVQTSIDATGVSFRPNPAKVAEWSGQI